MLINVYKVVSVNHGETFQCGMVSAYVIQISGSVSYS